MAKINQDCDLNVIVHGRGAIEINAIYNNKFIRRLYIGCDEKQARKKFTEALKKGEL